MRTGCLYSFQAWKGVKKKRPLAHRIHGQIVSHAVLPSGESWIDGFVRVFGDPLVDVLQDHLMAIYRHQRLVDQLSVWGVVWLRRLIGVF